MAQAQNYSTTNFENKSKDSISSIDPYLFDNNLINMIDFISEDSDNIMNDYLTHDEIIKTKIILVDNDRNTFENTITDNDFVLSIRENNFAVAADDADDNDDTYNRVQQQKELLKYINFVDYTKIERQKIQTEYNKYTALKSNLVVLQLRKQKYEKLHEENSMYNYFFGITSSKILWTAIGTSAVIGLNIAVCANLSNPATWISLASQIYNNSLLFGYFIDLMTMLDIFNINEKLALKQLFYQLKNQIDASKILKNPDGSLKDPSTLLPYDNKEFMEFFFTATINPAAIIDKPGDYAKQLEDFGNFIVKNPDGSIDITKKIEFINSVELNNFTSFITSIIDKKNIYKPITQSQIQNKWLALIMDTINSPYIYTVVSSLKIGGNIFGYIDTTIDAIQNVPNIDSTFVYRGATTAIRNSDSFKNITYLLSKGSLDVGVKSFNAIFGNELLKHGDEYLSKLPFIGGIVNGKNLEQIFVTSVSSIINAQITNSIDGYFKPMENELKMGLPGASDDDNKKGNIVDNIEYELKERVKYKKLGYTNEEIAELLESNPNKENDYQNFIIKGIRDFYKTFIRYSKNPKLIAYALCNCTGLFNIIIQLLSSTLIYSMIQDYVISGWFHYNFFDIGIELLKLNVMKIVTIIIESTLGGNYKLQSTLLNLKYEFIQTFLHDLTLFISDIQTLIYNKITDKASNKKYIDKFFSNFYFKIFKNCITLTYNILLIPSLNIQLNTIIAHGITEINIFDVLRDEEKCKKFFLFLNHKFYNMMIGAPKNLFKGNFNVNELVYYFQDFFYMEKILYNNVIPYFNLTTGYYDWDDYNLDSLSGSIIKIKSGSQTQSGTNIPGDYIILNSDLNKKEFQILSFDEVISQFKTEFGVTTSSTTGSILTSPEYKYKDSNNNDMSANLFQCITKYTIMCNDKDNFNTAFFWYYYDMFLKDSTTVKDPFKKDMHEFKKWLLENKMTEAKKNKSDENKVEYAILNSLVLELSKKSQGVSNDIFNITPPLDFNIETTITSQFKTFLDNLKTLGKTTTSDKVQTITQQNLISNMEDEIILPLEYWSMWGNYFTPVKFKTINFFTISNILNAITNNNKTTGLSNKIVALNGAAENNPKLKYVLNILEGSKKRELLEINKEVTKFSENFKTNFNTDNSVPLQYIGFNFEDFVKNCNSIIDLSFLQSITTGKDEYTIAVKKFVIEMSSIKNICTDNGKILFLYEDNNENIDANTGIKKSCTNIEVLNDSKLDDKLLYELLCRPSTLANIISNSNLYIDSLSTKDKLFVNDFISKININSEKLLNLIDFTLNDNTLLQDKLNFNSVTYFIDEILKDISNKKIFEKFKSPYKNGIVEYIKQISGIKYKCNDKNNNPIYFDINKNNLDTGGKTYTLCVDTLEEISDLDNEIAKNINSIILRPFFLEKSQEEIQIENLNQEQLDNIGYFRLDLKKIHNNIRKYQKNMYERIEEDVKNQIEILKKYQVGNIELYELFEIRQYLSFIKFKNLFSLVNEKSKLDSDIQKELLKYLTTDIKYIQNIRLLDSEYQEKIDNIDKLCAKPSGLPADYEHNPDIIPIRELFDREFLEDIVYKNINNQDETLYLGNGSEYYNDNSEIYDVYKKLFVKNQGDLQKLKSQSTFFTDISKKTGKEICGDPVYITYVDSIKQWYKVQENMRISFILWNANKKYTNFESNIKSNDENIWDFYISYSNDIDALYNEYIVNPQRIANALNNAPQASVPSSSQAGPPASVSKVPSLQEKSREEQTLPNSQFSEANVESATRAEVEKQEQAQDLVNQEDIGLTEDVGLESTESIDLQSVETTGLKLMNMFAQMFGGMGDFFSSLMTGKIPLSRSEIIKGVNQFREDIKEDNPSKVIDECKKYNNWQWETQISTKKSTIKFNDNTYDKRRQTFIKTNCNKENYIVFAFKKLVEFSSKLISLFAGGGVVIGSTMMKNSNNYIKVLGTTIASFSGAIQYAPHCFILVFYYAMLKTIDSFLKSGNLNTGQKILISFIAQAYNGYEAYIIENDLSTEICNIVFQTLNIGDDAASNIKLMVNKSLDACLTKKSDGTEFYNGMYKGSSKYGFNFYGNYDIGNSEEIQQEIIGLPITLSNFLTEKEKTIYENYKIEFEKQCPNGVVSDCSFYTQPFLKDTNLLKIVISSGDLFQVLNYVFCQVIDIPFSQFNILTLMMDIGRAFALIPFYIAKGLREILIKITNLSIDNFFRIFNDIKVIIINVSKELWTAMKSSYLLSKMLINLFNRRYESIKLFSNFLKIICKEKSIRNIFLFYFFGEKTTILGNKTRINPIRDIIDDALDGLDKKYRVEQEKHDTQQKQDVINFEKLSFDQVQIKRECENKKKKWSFNKNSNNQIDIFKDVDGNEGFNIIFDPTLVKTDKLFIINYCIEKYINDMDKMTENPYDLLKISSVAKLGYQATPKTIWDGWINTAYTTELSQLGDPNDKKKLDNAKEILLNPFLKEMYDELNIKPPTEDEKIVLNSYKNIYYEKIKQEDDFNDTSFLNKELTDVFTNFLNDTEKKLLKIISFDNWFDNSLPEKKNLKIYTYFEKCNKTKNCNSIDLLKNLFDELDKKVKFINYDPSQTNNPIVASSTSFNDLYKKAKDEFNTYIGKKTLKEKSNYYETNLKLTLTQLNDDLIQYQTKEGNEINFFCNLNNPKYVAIPNAVIRNGFDLDSSEKKHGLLIPKPYTCEQINDQINIYVSQTKDILNYFLKSSEVKGKIEEMSKNRGKSDNTSFISFAISNILSFITPSGKMLDITTKNYLLKPCNDNQFLFLNDFEPTCIDFIEKNNANIISDDKIRQLQQSKERYYNVKYDELKNDISSNLKNYIKNTLFTEKDKQNLYEYIKDDLKIENKINEFIEKFSIEIITKIKSDENPDKFMSKLNTFFYEKLMDDNFIFYHIEEKIKEQIVLIDQSITSTEQDNKDTLEKEKLKLESNLIFLTQLKKNMDELSKIPLNKETICRIDNYFCGLLKNNIEISFNLFDNFITQKIGREIKDDNELTLLYLYYNGIIKDSISSYSDEELSKIYKFYLNIIDSLKNKDSPEISEILLKNPNDPTKPIPTKFQTLLKQNSKFREKIRDNLFSILFKTNEINTYYSSSSYIITPKIETKVEIITPSNISKDPPNVNIFRNTVSTSNDKRMDFFSKFMGKDYKIDSTYSEKFLTLNNYGLFLRVGTNGLVVEPYNKRLQNDRTYTEWIYDLAFDAKKSLKPAAEIGWNFGYFLWGKYLWGSYGYDVEWDYLSEYAKEYNYQKIQVETGEKINHLSLKDSFNETIRVPFRPDNKVDDLPPTILYNYIEENPSTPTDQDVFVKKYYTDISYTDGMGITYIYKIFKPELEYYKYTFEDFNEDKFVKNLHKNSLKSTTQTTPLNSEFLNFFEKNIDKLIEHPPKDSSFEDVMFNGISYISGIPITKKSAVEDYIESLTFEERKEMVLKCIQEIKSTNKAPGILWNNPDIDSIEFKDIWTKSHCSLMTVQSNRILKVDLDSLFSYYKYSLIKKPKFDYLESLKIKGVPDIEKEIDKRKYLFNSFGEIFKLPNNDLFNSLKANFPISIFSLNNQLDFSITLDKSGNNVRNIKLNFDITNLHENTS